MTARRLSADTLIALAIATLQRDILADASAEQRAAGALIARALEVARREITTDGEEVQWKLLDAIYDDGDGTLAQLAKDIRAGTIDERKHADLAERLRELVIAELRIANPAALERRRARLTGW